MSKEKEEQKRRARLSAPCVPAQKEARGGSHARRVGRGGHRPKGSPARPNAFATDVRRTITGNLKKFVSLAVITALGATLLVGLKAACDDLRFTADSYYDAQRLFDISIQSTLGLNGDDIKALGKLEGVDVAEGGYSETAYTTVDGASQKVDVKALSPAGLNEPRVLEGRLPRDTNEVAVTQKYLDASGKKIGDEVTFEGLDEDEAGAAGAARNADAAVEASAEAEGDAAASPTGDQAASTEQSSAIFKRRAYTITGAVLDPMDVNAGSKTMSFRSTGGAQYAFFLTPGAVADRDTFTIAYLTVNGATDLMTYSDEYKALIDDVKQRAEGIREQREIARTDGLKADANDAIDARQEEANEQLKSAQGKIDDALAQIESGKAELSSQGASAQAQLDAAQRQFDASRAQIDSALASTDMIASVMGDAWPASAWQRLQNGDSSARAEFVSAVEAYAQGIAAKVQQGTALCDALIDAVGKLPAGDPANKQRAIELVGQLELAGHISAEQASALVSLINAYPENDADITRIQNEIAGIKQGIEQLGAKLPANMSGMASMLADGALSKPMLAAAQAELDRQRAELAQRLAEGKDQLAIGAGQAAEGQAELDRQRADAEARFADARSEVDGIERATWYIQDRTSLPSYASIESDASSIESIATVFPLIFFTVAVLISLTTVTRMVEEDRGLIGVYKALGYSRGRILSKYLIYAFASCLVGGFVGDALGFIVLPEIIFTIFKTMYALPPFQLHFNVFTAVLGIALFAIGIVGATFLACRHVLKETPASLMRPKAPRAGKRILLERITPLWRRLSFLNKVSARNLFRYKKRFLMTVFGIAGCTALMICGLGIRDTVISLKPRQYGDQGVVRYDLLAVATDDDFAQGERELRATGAVDTMLEARVDSVTVELNGAKESVQLVVVPNGADLSAYMRTEDGSNTTFFAPAIGGENLELPREGAGALVTKNIEQVLGLQVGDELQLQDTTLRTGTVRAEGITVSFLGNFVFMTEDAYEQAFGEQCVPNAFFANLTGSNAEKIELADELSAGDTFVSVSSSAKIADSFGDSFKIIDVVVYVVTVMAGALAFAVVFTLSNTNISERERELATIKVLGFRRREVYRYINKETIILTLIGIVAGWPLGYFITRFLTYVLRMPSLFFDTIVEPQTYLFASVMSLVFTLIINRFTNRSLDKIDMVGALKSAE
ncbi:MAG: FtsX-like permease family protein [Coriobacteriaceae bacterium]|nr:FtsX-like permease family protein [Coriobacteriaceae bacterium]